MASKILPVILMVSSGPVFAAHPLVTDDTGTQGKGRYELELGSEFSRDRETIDGVAIKTTAGSIAPVLAIGATDDLDIEIGLAYARTKETADGATTRASGKSDSLIGLKWRFFDEQGLSFALKPGIILPTGDENKGLGAGKTSYVVDLLATKEMAPWAFHFNLGYTHNNYKLQADLDSNRKNIPRISAAAWVDVTGSAKLFGDIGVERNADKASRVAPGFFMTGIIYSVSKDLDLDLGIKFSLNKPEPDRSVLAGVTWRF